MRANLATLSGARIGLGLIALVSFSSSTALAQRTVKPVLHGEHWMAITGKPLAATAGALTFNRGGNAVDAACAMLAATSTMWDTLSWGGETQALIYNPHTGEVKGINALGVAPTGATPEFFHKQGMVYPPEYGPLAAVTPGTPGGLMVMLAEYGKLSLAEVLAPAMEMARGYPIEKSQADNIESRRELLATWPGSKKVFLPHFDANDTSKRAAPEAGEIFRQPELLATLQKLVDAEAEALAAGKTRKQAIQAAYDRFYRGDIAQQLVAGSAKFGGLMTMQDLDRWQVHIEEPVTTNYKGIDVYKLTTWVQGPVMLQALNMLEKIDIKSMGYNSARYIHTLYQVMNLAFADRDFYYGDPYVPPVEPIAGLLSKKYADQRRALINPERNDVSIKPGDPYPFQNGKNPYLDLLKKWQPNPPKAIAEGAEGFQQSSLMTPDEAFLAGTTSIQAADAEGWVVSVTPSGGWIPAFIPEGTGIGLSQRMQSFVLDKAINPFNVVQPGQRPRATLTPSLALKDGKPLMAFSVQGGDTQDQNLLQFFLDMVEFKMNVQQAAEAHNILSYQMQSSFGAHQSEPGRVQVTPRVSEWDRAELGRMGYKVEVVERTYSPITAIWLDQKHGTLWGGASEQGDDYGIAW
ncbi:gamma-glutamyltransferase family protein [Dokdonella immobilis]|uniref:Gamma-glutamyltranspeptidase / glutathione hydrolase n=1 Tax=Dokdonella immobilis TaxID=578942 RepID=A0A1I4Y755_9GAMM|nr:gamma-glutamyltransferase family protein [Dokdonella immobilis]SFN33553.1 gamma-glutamyltranspeptidase / glutathione hydrolase [Dokdonella immobilis]